MHVNWIRERYKQTKWTPNPQNLTMPETAQGSAQERVGRPTHQSKGASEKAHKQAKRLKWNKVGTPTKRRNGKWERSQASGKAHNQVWNAKIQTPLLNPKEFSNTKTAAAVHSANNGENSTEFFCPQRGTTTLVTTPIERNWVFTSSSISTATHSAMKVF